MFPFRNNQKYSRNILKITNKNSSFCEMISKQFIFHIIDITIYINQ